jgi:hypothetical protein
MRIILITFLTITNGCAVCRPHPQVCVAGAAFVAASIAISVNQSGGHRGPRPMATVQPVSCAANTCQ